MWSNQITHKLLLNLQNSTSTLDVSLVGSYVVKQLLYDPTFLLLSIYSREVKTRSLKAYLTKILTAAIFFIA